MRKSGITPNGPKVREAVLHVIRAAEKRGQTVTQFEVLKTLFIADRAHLNLYGRPITYDEYVAMEDGPVPSLAYDLLKEEGSAAHEAGLEKPLWRRKAGDAGKFFFYGAERDASDEVLSESDFEELTNAFELIKKWGISQTWKRVHQDAAYKDAWAKVAEGSKQYPMDYALLFDEPDERKAKELKFTATLR